MNTRYNDYNNIENLKERMQTNEVVLLKGKKYDTLVGKGLQLKINSSVGLSDEGAFKTEADKITKMAGFDVLPDTMMDLSIISAKRPLYDLIQKEIALWVQFLYTYVLIVRKE